MLQAIPGQRAWFGHLGIVWWTLISICAAIIPPSEGITQTFLSFVNYYLYVAFRLTQLKGTSNVVIKNIVFVFMSVNTQSSMNSSLSVSSYVYMHSACTKYSL